MMKFLKRGMLALALLCALPVGAQKISADPTAATLTGGEYLAGVQSAANVKVLPSQILTYTLTNLHKINAQTGTSYAIVAGDRWKHITFSNASSQAVTIAQAGSTGFADGFGAYIEAIGAGTVTITPATSTINGASSLALTTGQSAILFSDGANYRAIVVQPAFVGGTLTSLLSTVATGTGSAGFRLPHGTAPSSPTNGDVWTTTAGLYARINGTTVGPFGSGGGTPGGSDTYVQYNNSGAFGGTSTFAFASGVLSVPSVTTTGLITTAASATGGAGLRLPHGDAPTSPTNGDIWTTSAGGLYVRINGATVGPLGASGGGALSNFTEAVNTSTPNATVPVVSLTATNAGTNVDIALTPKGTGALTRQIADNSTTGGNKRGTGAVDWQQSRASASQVANGNYSTIAGGDNNTASGVESAVGGGIGNVASGAQSAISGGSGNTASAATTYVGGGDTNTASNTNAATLGGATNTSSGLRSATLGGSTNTASGNDSIAHGISASTRGLIAARASSGGTHNLLGQAQGLDLYLRGTTTDATPLALTVNASAVGSTNVLAIPDNAVVNVFGQVNGRTSAGVVSSWYFYCSILRGSGAASTAMVSSCTPVLIAQSGGASGWALAVTADTTNGALAVTVTGAAATTIRWGARIQDHELVY